MTVSFFSILQLVSLLATFLITLPSVAAPREKPKPSRQALLNPLQNPLAMTLTQALAMPSTDSALRGSLNVLPKRAPTPLFEDLHDLRFRYQLQTSRTAPLVFILPGTGGVASSPGALFLAERLFRQGYHVVTLDNPFSWSFALAASRSSLPGYTPDDVVDLYDVMQKVRAKLVREARVNPRSYGLVGYSLGALQSVFLKKIDNREQAFRFQKVLLINPPVDLLYALNTLDSLYAKTAALSEERKTWVLGQVYYVGERYLAPKAKIDFTSPKFLSRAFADLKFDQLDITYLISKTFRDSLRDVILASQQVRDLHVLKNPMSNYSRNARIDEAASISYNQYVQRFLLPTLRARNGVHYRIEDLNQQASLHQFADELRTDTSIFMVHSQDDFITKPSDLAWLKNLMGSRATIFPYGGHCGAINFPQFGSQLKVLFTSR